MNNHKIDINVDETEVIIVRGKEVGVSKDFKRKYESMNRRYHRKQKQIRIHEMLYDFSCDKDDYDHFYEIDEEVNKAIADSYPMCISAEVAALKNIDREELRQAILELFCIDQQLIIQLFFYRMTFRDVSNKMHVSPSTIYEHLQVVLSILGKKLKNFH